MGVQGVFTKNLDIALLSNKIDIAVHSMKDVPVCLAEGLCEAAVLPRGNHRDVLVYKESTNAFKDEKNDQLPGAEFSGIIATSSIRRRAQWLHRYPNSQFVDIRGNIHTRLGKLAVHDWHGAIFASAGLERLDAKPQTSLDLDWMLPAPAQGAIMVVCRAHDAELKKKIQSINHLETAFCVKAERDFLQGLMGGCTAPISALAQCKNGRIYFQGNILSVDGKKKKEVFIDRAIENGQQIGIEAANELLGNGGDELIRKFQ
jgi:hydroxymethylbilane synthase